VLAVVALAGPWLTSPGAAGDPASVAVGRATVDPPVTTPVEPIEPAPPPVADRVAPTEALPLPLPGCPLPPRPPAPVFPPGWQPPVLVPEADLPEPGPPPNALVAGLAPIEGKGMWVWRVRQTEGGDPDAIIGRAQAAGLRQLWVRVGDSRDGFYASGVLDDLVPRAHRAGMAVIGWGFPFLHDPVDDARWSAEALAWRGPAGEALDGFSPDIELATEGVVLTERRARVYLSRVREAAGDRLLVATVYRPTDRLWTGSYPYTAIADYVDAFAPMVYWGCAEPGTATAEAVDRLSPLRPVHVIGQGYDAGIDGGRPGSPSAEETVRFLDVAARSGAIGASFWVWQSIDDEQWEAMSSFPWYPVGAEHG
jgi:hypothetical protein